MRMTPFGMENSRVPSLITTHSAFTRANLPETWVSAPVWLPVVGELGLPAAIPSASRRKYTVQSSPARPVSIGSAGGESPHPPAATAPARTRLRYNSRADRVIVECPAALP